MISDIVVKYVLFLLLGFQIIHTTWSDTHSSITNHVTTEFKHLAKYIVPSLEGKTKGEAGKIGVIGGSIEYTGAPYFAAISALKVGADLVYVITTESAAPVIKSYSPDLIVYPYLNIKSASKISSLIHKMDVVVIGPGLGREEEAMKLTEDIIKTCKTLGKPLVIDADGLYALSLNPNIIVDYPKPGVIITPNQREANKLKEAVSGNGKNSTNWFNYWGAYTSVLVKGPSDQFFSGIPSYNWASSQGGTGRRAAGQGDILSGSLATVYSWAIKYKEFLDNTHRDQLGHSVASYAAAQFTRMCNSKAYDLYGRSMTASNMLEKIHEAFIDIFE